MNKYPHESHDAFYRPGRTESIYGAVSSRITSNNRLGEIPYFADSSAGQSPVEPAPEIQSAPPKILKHVEDLLTDILGIE